MKSKVRTAMFKILELESEFSSSEIDEAYKIIEELQLRKTLGLRNNSYKNPTQKAPRRVNSSKQPSPPSALLESLGVTDQEKLNALKRINNLIIAKDSKLSLDDIRKIAIFIDKSFEPRKSKKETAPGFLKLLANLPTIQIEEMLKKMQTASLAPNNSDSTYFELANYLVSGDNK